MDSGGVAVGVDKLRLFNRTRWIVLALVAAMGLATVGLVLLEPANGPKPPIMLVNKTLQTGVLAQSITQTSIPIQAQNWRRVVVVAVPLNSEDAVQPFCHFFVSVQGKVEPTEAWVNQVRASRDDARVHVLVQADWSGSYPSQVQNEAVVTLLRLVYQLGQPAEWAVELDIHHCPTAHQRMDWVFKVAANVYVPSATHVN